MSDEAALLAAIRAHPDEATPRLAYADWLDEQGGASNTDRAEYIRLEVQIARDFTQQGWWKAEDDARRRPRQLFWKHRAEWFPAFYGRKNLLRGARAYVRTRRGFPYSISVRDPYRVVQVGEQLLELAPITELVLNDVDDFTLSQLLAKPWLSRIRNLNLTGYGDPDWAALTDSPHLRTLQGLVLCYGELTPEGAARIAKENPLPGLKRLDLAYESSDAALAKLFSKKAFTGLEELEIDTDRVSVAGIQALGSAACLRRLKALRIPFKKLPGLAPVLAGAGFWPNLEELEITRCGIGDAGLSELLSKRTKLRVLKLDENKITATGARRLAESPVLANLTTLDVSKNKLGAKGIAAIAGSPRAANLKVLDVCDCALGSAGITAIAESPHLANLRELWMDSNGLDLASAKALAASPQLANLTRLYTGGGLTATAKKVLRARFGDAVSF